MTASAATQTAPPTCRTEVNSIRGLDPRAERQTITWAARVLVEAAIKEG